MDQPHQTRIREQDVRFLVRRSPRRRSIELQVDENGLIVHAPWRASEQRVLRALQTHADWVLDKLQAWRTTAPRVRQWVEGSVVPFLGRELRLELVGEATTPVRLMDDDRLQVRVARAHQGVDHEATTQHIRDTVVAWYRRHAQPQFVSSVQHHSLLLEVAPPKVFLSNARGRWGSCNSRAQVRLNWRLIQARQAVIDYVVVHELAHLREMNHSARFWSLVESACPGYRAARADLDRVGGDLMAL